MTNRELENLYFEWMYKIVSSKTYSRRTTYRQLLEKLHNIPFAYKMRMDENRAWDGVDLRYKFGNDADISASAIARCLDTRPCSVLEMMIALAIRCETNIMADPEVGNRTGRWFWDMIDSLGLGGMTDLKYDEAYVEHIVDIFMRRRYEPNGEGGLFTVPNTDKDLRSIEIWYQMHLYLENET